MSRTLSEAAASYKVTRNPIYAWFATWHCLANDKPLPLWVHKYLLDIADLVMELARNAGLKDRAKADQAAKAIGLGAPRFKRFTRTEENKKAADNLPLYEFVDQAAQAAAEALGIDRSILLKKQIVAAAVSGGSGSARTIHNRLTEGRKIRGLQVRFGKKQR